MTPLPFKPPRPWLWSCHRCHNSYPLGATRRCLHDGHYFCGGTTTSSLTGRPTKTHKACGSEFDYLGWQDVFQWRERLNPPQRNLRDRGSRRHQKISEKAAKCKKREKAIELERSCEVSCKYPTACHNRPPKIQETGREQEQQRRKKDQERQESFLDTNCKEIEPASLKSSSNPDPLPQQNLHLDHPLPQGLIMSGRKDIPQSRNIYIHKSIQAANQQRESRPTYRAAREEDKEAGSRKGIKTNSNDLSPQPLHNKKDIEPVSSSSSSSYLTQHTPPRPPLQERYFPQASRNQTLTPLLFHPEPQLHVHTATDLDYDTQADDEDMCSEDEDEDEDEDAEMQDPDLDPDYGYA